MHVELKSGEKKEGWEGGGGGGGRKKGAGGKKKEADGYCKLNWLREGSDFHCDEPE